ncbi:hypothetical protein [Actinomadura rugatobispora]|uniref:Uncharacterized protein n=1 Tax=Actinomadura rugatobispora TaxID=1994 RepID=A0ABW1A2Z3_9ACTN
MNDLIAEAWRMTRIPCWACHREDRGDGALFIVPPEVAADHLLAPYASHLNLVLRRHNQLADPTTRMRLRLAVHTERIHRDDHGVVGPALVHLFRLLDAPAFKRFADDAVG